VAYTLVFSFDLHLVLLLLRKCLSMASSSDLWRLPTPQAITQT